MLILLTTVYINIIVNSVTQVVSKLKADGILMHSLVSDFLVYSCVGKSFFQL